jgi:hypothetical protein
MFAQQIHRVLYETKILLCHRFPLLSNSLKNKRTGSNQLNM